MGERPAAEREPWSDTRLDAAFATIAPAGAPRTLAAEVALRLDDAATRRRWVPLFALAGLAAALVVAVVGGALVTGLGPFAGFQVRTGADGRSIFDGGEFSFSFPSTWQVTTTGLIGTGGVSSIAVLGTLPVESRCGIGRADINCVYEQPLDRGTIRVYVGTAAYRGSTILDRPDTGTGTTTRLTVGGMPAILDEHPATPDDFYRADLSLEWQIARPVGLNQVVTIEVMARDPGVAEARAAAEALIASFRYGSPPATLPPDREDGIRVAHAAIVEDARAFRDGWNQVAGLNHYDCQPDRPDIEAHAAIRFSPGGDLGGDVPVTCSWTLDREGDTFWRVTMRWAWTAGDASGVLTETQWLDAGGTVVSQEDAGTYPPIVGPVATEPPTGTPTNQPGDSPPPRDAVLGLPVMTVEEALANLATNPGDAEIAVEGWWSGSPAIPCPWDPLSESSPAYPRCPDGFSYLMADPEAVVTIGANGMSSRAPLGPYLAPLVRDGVQVPSTAVRTEGGVEPTRVIVLGHAHDHRAGLCPADARARCEAAFLLDLAFEPGLTPPVVRDGEIDDSTSTTVGTEDQAVTLARMASGAPFGRAAGLDPDPAVIAVMRLSRDAVARVEPALAARGSGMKPLDVTWVVKLLVPDGEGFRIRTFAMRDADVAGFPANLTAGISVYEPTADGVTVHAVQSDAGFAGSPSVAP